MSDDDCLHPSWWFSRSIETCGAPNCDERMHYHCDICGISDCWDKLNNPIGWEE